MICTRTLTIDPPGTHSLLGIDILMRCNLDIDRSLCFPAAIQSESATTIKTARVLETGEGHPECWANFSAGWRPGSRCISSKESHHLASFSIVNSRAKSKSLRSDLDPIHDAWGEMLVEAPEWEPRELVVVLLANNLFWRTADVIN